MNYPIASASDIGNVIKMERKRQGVLQRDVAEMSGVSLHFLSNLENGKPAVELQKVLQVFLTLGISMQVITRQPETGRS